MMADRRTPTDDAFFSDIPNFDAEGVCIAITLRQGDATTTAWRTVAEAEALAAHITEAIAGARAAQDRAAQARFQQAAE